MQVSSRSASPGPHRRGPEACLCAVVHHGQLPPGHTKRTAAADAATIIVFMLNPAAWAFQHNVQPRQELKRPAGAWSRASFYACCCVTVLLLLLRTLWPAPACVQQCKTASCHLVIPSALLLLLL
jgi:hypothetical protein